MWAGGEEGQGCCCVLPLGPDAWLSAFLVLRFSQKTAGLVSATAMAVAVRRMPLQAYVKLVRSQGQAPGGVGFLFLSLHHVLRLLSLEGAGVTGGDSRTGGCPTPWRESVLWG